jgi:hypothetical protein
MDTQDLIERAKAFMRAVASGAPAQEIEAFYALDAVEEEFPNRLLPNGAVRNLEALREAGKKGRKVMSAQTIEIVNAVGTGQCVAIEAIWTGTLAVGMGSLKPGVSSRLAARSSSN